MTKTTRVHLSPIQFTEKETTLVEHGELTASVFRFPSGVNGLRLKNSLGELVILPYNGQQIWSAKMRGRDLTMKSMFNQPLPTRDFLSSYGCFLTHCGATAIGVPGPGDNHPLHGDLPLAPYNDAWLELGEDDRGKFIALGGKYEHILAFNFHYYAEPLVKMYEGSSIFNVQMQVTNLKQSKMPLMYLTHVNFRPVDHGRLVYTVKTDSDHMRVRAEFPDFMEVEPEFRTFVQDLKAHPEKHMVLKPEMKYDPEVVLFMDFESDPEGWAHAMQVHPDGSADVVRHRTDQLDHGQVWICRTPDQEALGFEPASAEGTGFTSEKAKGNVKWLAAGERFIADLQIGVLTAVETKQEEELIRGIAQKG